LVAHAGAVDASVIGAHGPADRWRDRRDAVRANPAPIALRVGVGAILSFLTLPRWYLGLAMI
jgi:hypothetical protein